MRIMVLGAGVIGITTAYELYRAGHEVIVVDRAAYAGAECSFANGSQLSISHAEPWAQPSLWRHLPRFLFSPDSPLVLRPSIDRHLYAWLLRFLWQCRASAVSKTLSSVLSLALESQAAFEDTLKNTDIECDYRKSGLVHLYHTKDEFDVGCGYARAKSPFLKYHIDSDAADLEAREPAFAHSDISLHGGIYYPDDASANTHAFTTGLASYLEARGVEFLYNTNIRRLCHSGNNITGVEISENTLQADAYVMCLGAYSPVLARPLGLSLPIYPMKGYSVSLDLGHIDHPVNTAIIDHSHKMVYSRLGNILRIAGMAEFNGYDHSVHPDRTAWLLTRAYRLFPQYRECPVTHSWACLRPSTPDGVPIIGPSSYDNLYLNTGHGSLGWTLSHGSARRIVGCLDRA